MPVLFKPGRVVATRGALEKINASYAVTCLSRHLHGNWGLCGAEDRAANNAAVKDGTRIMSVYPLPNDAGNFWVITEADRSVTTFLLPDEY